MQSAKRSFSWKDFFRFGKKRVEIVTETRRSLTIRRTRVNTQRECFYCETDSTYLSFEEVAVMFKTDEKTLGQFVAENEVHSVLSDSNQSLICLESFVSKFDRK